MCEPFFRNTPQFETKRLLLRKLIPEDAEDIFAYAMDNEVTKIMTWDTHNNIEDSRQFIKFTLDRYTKDDAGDWGIILKETGKLIGVLGFVYFDKKNRWAELGYVLRRSYWGKGIMPEAVNRILQFAFNDIQLNRVLMKLASMKTPYINGCNSITQIRNKPFRDQAISSLTKKNYVKPSAG